MVTLTNVNLPEVKERLYELLKPSGWGDKLKTFIMSDDMDKILSHLYNQATSGERFTPPLKQVFRFFQECPYNELKVVMIGQDPYPGLGEADGIAFSCSNTGKPAASMRYLFKEIENTVYKDGYTWDPDLKRWSNQGMLLMNTALTTTINKVGTHYDVWQPFIAFLLDTLAFNQSGLVYVFLGKKAQEWAESVPDSNYKIFVSHPASAAYKKAERWDSEDMFNKISKLVYNNFKEKIIW